MRPSLMPIATAVMTVAAACSSSDSTSRAPSEEGRVDCARRNPSRDVFFGDLHVHTSLSFDAWVFDVRTTPADAYRFAQGQPIDHPLGTPEQVQLARPLDFAAVTDHSEYLGEVNLCTTPGSDAFDAATCADYRPGGASAIFDFGTRLTSRTPRRFSDVCGATGERCRTVARDEWARIQEAAEAAYDRSAACSFTSFIGYEWTAAINASNLHRNVIFKTADVPDTVTSYFDLPAVQTAPELVRSFHRVLSSTCLNAEGCDVIAIPHNSNWSNGNMFVVEYPGATSIDDERSQANLRQTLEPLFEIYQHKGDAECSNGLSGILGEPDELCDFEKLRIEPPDCGDRPDPLGGGSGGVGCVSRLDFLRGILLEGLKEEARLGVNPYRLGVVASTDTHNGTPGEVSERAYPGHWGNNEDTVQARLGPNPVTPGGVLYSGGGLTAAWAEQNTRTSLFEAFRRREVYGTSGPRITVRFFGGWSLPATLCQDPNLVELADRDGVPMGADLPPLPGPAFEPTFVVSALMDAGTPQRAGVPLERLQIVKGWLDADGQANIKVFDIAGREDTSTVDLATCERSSRGEPQMCSTWTDPEFVRDQPAFYYARVLEDPSCRWSWWACLSLPEDERPTACTDPTVPKIIQERAWTSPIWYQPAP